ncbi:GTP binding protein [Aureococcus anophagefferens]|nr:GTP binding protein [Aureococcus anophagefferens]
MRAALAAMLAVLGAALRSPLRQTSHKALTSLRAAGDTIYALSSGRGVAGVAVVRVSGPSASDALAALTPGKPLPAHRVASLRTLRDASDVLDEALVLRFEAPRSFTGEDVVELHCHGGEATVDGVLEALDNIPKLRAADRGEFTRRAFAAGKLGLTEVEGLADLLAAKTAPQRRQALAQMGGSMERTYARWRGELASLRASAEVLVDFGDGVGGVADQSDDIRAALDASVRSLKTELDAALTDAPRGEATRDGVRVVLAGAPNAGKSSLLNAVAARDAAIVSQAAGTTRDVLEIGLSLGGLPARLFDTAGLRVDGEEDSWAVEVEGMRRAAGGEAAHVVVFVLDAADDDASAVADAFRAIAPVWRRDDGAPAPELAEGLGAVVAAAATVRASATAADGAAALVDDLERRVVAAFRSSRDDYEAPAITRARHRTHVASCVACLDAVLSDPDLMPELVAEERRAATSDLGAVVGAVDTEQVSDVLFNDFCIGK